MAAAMLALQETLSLEAMRAAASQVLSQHMDSDTEEVAKLTPLIFGLFEYQDFTEAMAGLNEIAFVERKFNVPVPEFGFNYGFTVDLGIVTGGKLELWDWKFTQDFYDGNLIVLMPQLPRYVAAAGVLGWSVSKARYVNIRTRQVKAETPKYKFLPANINRTVRMSHMKDLLLAVEEILKFKAMPLDAWRDRVPRTASSFSCKHCAFKEICSEEIQGQDPTNTIEHLYMLNTRYGYGPSAITSGSAVND